MKLSKKPAINILPVFAAFLPGILFEPEDWGGKFF
jgi:hypothetical protein